MSIHSFYHASFSDGAPRLVSDPGADGTIRPDKEFAVCELTGSASAEARALADPKFPGQRLTVVRVDALAGLITVTAASGVDTAGNTALAFGSQGDLLDLVASQDGTSAYAWRVTAQEGVTGPAEALSDITVESITGSDNSLGITGQTQLTTVNGGLIAIAGAASIAGATGAGGAVTVAGGASGSTAGAGGLVSLTGGLGTTTGDGGAVSATSGAGGTGAGATGGDSGAVTVASGASGTETTGTAGAGGAVALTAAAGGAATGAAGIGGTGGANAVTAGAGGAASNASGGNAGAGGAATMLSGVGGAAAGTGGAGGGAGGATSVTAGAGGTAAGTSASGAGGAASLVAGAAGAKTGTTNAVGGVGGAAVLTGGAGGATASNGSDAGGVGGDVTVTAGVGGAASAGTGDGGAGGSILLVNGAGGASSGGTAGVRGDVYATAGQLTDYRTETSEATAGAGTYTAAALKTGIIMRDCTGGARTDTTDTATNILAAFPDAVVGTTISCYVINISDAAEAITIAGGTDVTFDTQNVAGTIGQSESVLLLLRFTAVGGSPTMDGYIIGQ